MVTFRQARQLTGLSGATLRRWTREGRLPDRRSAGGQRVFVLSELEAPAGAPLRSRHEPSGSTVVAYARVSSRRQAAEGDLERQIERLRGWVETERQGSELLVFSDVGSGLSDNRSGLCRVLARVQRDDVSEIVITHRERLARFGKRAWSCSCPASASR